MTYTRSESRFRFLSLVALAALCLAGCSESPPPRAPAPPPRPPFQPQAIEVKLGEHGGAVTLMTTEAGGYTRNGNPFGSGDTVEGSNGGTYKLTLSEGRWSAAYVAPDPVELRLGLSGVTLSLTRLEDGSYEANGQPVASGDLWEAPTGSEYRLTLTDGQWTYEYAPPDPVELRLGLSGVTLSLTRLEDGSYEANGRPVASGDLLEAPTGSEYRLTLTDGQWTYEYAPPDPVELRLGLSGVTLSLTRLEDGSYEANGRPVASGDLWEAPTGSEYRLTLTDGQWTYEYAPPDPVELRLGLSGVTLSLTRLEDGSYEANGRPVASGDLWEAPTGSEYRLTLTDGQWTYEYAPPDPVELRLGLSGVTLSLTRLEDGSYEANGRPVASGDLWEAPTGSEYRLTLTDGQWTYEYAPPDPVELRLGLSGVTLSLTRLEDGSYEANGRPVASGDLWEAPTGSEYRLTLTDGQWTYEYAPPDPVELRLGLSGVTLSLTRLEDGSYEANGRPVASGDLWEAPTGGEYRLTLADGRWTYEYVAPDPVPVTLGASGEVAQITRREDGNFEINGELFTSGGIYQAENGNRYRISFANGQWTARFEPPSAVRVALGRSGLSISVTRQEDGSYRAGNLVIQDGGIITATNGNQYRMTLSDGTWRATFVAPNATPVTLGTSGEVIYLTLREDGLYESGGRTISSGGTWQATNGNQYRLTRLSTGQWEVEFLPPPPATVLLGTSGRSVVVITREDGLFEVDGFVFSNGGEILSSGNRYRMTLTQSGWSAVYVPPDAVAVALGTSGDALVIRRQEDGRYRAGDQTIVSGGIVNASNGNRYRLTLVRTAAGERWQVDFIPPEPFRLRLGTSGSTRLIAQNEDGSYTVGGRLLRSGDTLTADNQSRYRVTLSNDTWTAEYIPEPEIVRLGTSGDTVAVTRLENGSYAVGGERIVSGYEYAAPNGNTYRLTFSDGQWTADFQPTQVVVPLGQSGQTVTLVREEDGQYWLGRKVIQDRSTHTLPGGKVYLLTLTNGEWTAEFVEDVVQVPAGQSGTNLILRRLEDGKLLFEGREVRVGDTLRADNGNEYVLQLRDGQLVADFKVGTETIPLGTSGNSVTLVKQEDGTYTRNGRIFRSGQSVTADGVTYRLTLGSGGWVATRTGTGGGGTPGIPGGGGSGPTREDERKFSFNTNSFGLKDEGDATTGNKGTLLVVGTTEYSVYDLVGRGIVSRKQTYVEVARNKLRKIVETITNYKALYDLEVINPDVHIREGGLDGNNPLWDQAKTALATIADDFQNRLSPGPWRGTTIEADEVDDVIEELNDVIEDLGSASGLDDGFTLPTGYTAQQIFDASISEIKFGSRGQTRFAAFATNSSSEAASDASWSTNVFAYSPLERTATGDLPTRGQATYRGSTVAVAPNTDTFYSGDIELLVKFSTGRVDALIEDLVDEDGTSWTHDSKAVEYVHLPVARLTGQHNGGFSVSNGDARVRYEQAGAEGSVGSSDFEGQFVNTDREVLGTWEIGSLLQGAFGVSKSTPTRETKPSFSDSGTVSVTAADDSKTPDSSGYVTFKASDPLIKFDARTLYSSKRRTQSGARFVTEARSVIIKQIQALDILISAGIVDAAQRTTLWNNSRNALNTIFGSSTTYENIASDYPTGSNKDTTARQKLVAARDALNSKSAFTNAIGSDDDDIFKGAGATADQVDAIFAAIPYDFKVEFDYTNYTRFGAWANPTRTHAAAAASFTDHGVFAYSPLGQTSLDSNDTYNFTAVYEGKTAAVDPRDGELYRGVFQVRVAWDSSGGSSSVTASARDLRKTSNSSWLQHNGLDVGFVVFSGLSVNNSGSAALSGTPTVKVQYRASGIAQVDVSGSHALTGKFLGKGVDGPWGVVGTWTVAGSNASSVSLKGGYGADLLP